MNALILLMTLKILSSISISSFMKCVFLQCCNLYPHHSSGEWLDINSQAAFIQHIHSTHSENFHLANLRLCQEANISTHVPNVIARSSAATKSSNATIPQQHATNTDLCLAHIVGENPPNYTLVWSQALNDNIKPDPVNFRTGLQDLANPRLSNALYALVTSPAC